MKPRKPLAVAFPAFLAAFTTAAFAQQPPSPPPSWQQGRGAEQASSPLHPFAIEVTGKSAKQLPVDKLKVPAGFKVEVWVDGAPGARSMALGDKGTVFVGTRQLKDVYAVVERGGKREVKTILKGLESPNGIVFSKGTLYVAEHHRITRREINMDQAGDKLLEMMFRTANGRLTAAEALGHREFVLIRLYESA